MGDMKADNSWKVYLATDDMAKTLATAEAEGARVVAPAMTVADLGTQAVLIDPTGATVGVWQPETFHGFSVLDEPGAPDWFELQTRDYAKAVAFYRSAFGWGTNTVGDSDDFRYTVMRHPSGDGELAGIMDAGAFLPEGRPSHWSVYFEVDAIGTTAERAVALGGSVVTPPQDTPYGQLATLTDTAGAYFKLRSVKR